jgi:hypothetical protein
MGIKINFLKTMVPIWYLLGITVNLLKLFYCNSFYARQRPRQGRGRGHSQNKQLEALGATYFGNVPHPRPLPYTYMFSNGDQTEFSKCEYIIIRENLFPSFFHLFSCDTRRVFSGWRHIRYCIKKRVGI